MPKEIQVFPFPEDGSEIAGGVRNVFIENIRIPKASNAIYFKSNPDRGAYIENVYVRNIQADTVRTALVRFEPDYKGERSSFHPTLFDNFLIENVDCRQSMECGIYIAGFRELPVRNIRLKDITVGKVPVPYCLENGEQVDFDNVRINGKRLPSSPEPERLVRLSVL